MIRVVGANGQMELQDDTGGRYLGGQGAQGQGARTAPPGGQTGRSAPAGQGGRIYLPEGFKLIHTEIQGRYKVRDQQTDLVFWLEHLEAYQTAKAADQLVPTDGVWTPDQGSADTSSTAAGAIPAVIPPPVVVASSPTLAPAPMPLPAAPLARLQVTLTEDMLRTIVREELQVFWEGLVTRGVLLEESMLRRTVLENLAEDLRSDERTLELRSMIANIEQMLTSGRAPAAPDPTPPAAPDPTSPA